MRWLGIDNGTHSSTVGYVNKAGQLKLIAGIPSIIYFPPFDRRGNKETFFGHEAVEAYGDEPGGNLILAFKSLLGTNYPGQTFRGYLGTWDAINLTKLFLFKLKQLAELKFGEKFDGAVIGRPANFSKGAQLELVRAALGAGFKRVRLMQEPIAAAASYLRSGASAGERIAVVDIGGGTSDIAIFIAGTKEVPVTGGVSVAGNAFNTALTRAHLLRFFGKGATYGPNRLPVPDNAVNAIANWKAMRFIDQRSFQGVQHYSSDPEGVGRLLKIYQQRLGYSLFQAVDEAKQILSEQKTASVVSKQLGLKHQVSRSEFQVAIDRELRTIKAITLATLRKARCHRNNVQTVILTGGSALTPAVQSLVRDVFPNSKILLPDPVATVGGGLALKAAALTS